MFETLFMSDLFDNYKNKPEKFEDLNDPLDECLSRLFDRVKRVIYSLKQAFKIKVPC